MPLADFTIFFRRPAAFAALEVKAEKQFEKAVSHFDEVHEKNLGHVRARKLQVFLDRF